MKMNLEPLPITLVFGFSGSGKTTLINALLAQAQEPVQVLNSSSQELQGGCICCTGLADLQRAIDQFLTERQQGGIPYQRLVVEASHATDPIPVIRTLQNFFSPEFTFISEAITVVQASDYPPPSAPRWLVTNQIFFVDKVVVNHCDRASAEQIEQCHQHIRSIKWLPILNATQGRVNRQEIWPSPVVV